MAPVAPSIMLTAKRRAGRIMIIVSAHLRTMPILPRAMMVRLFRAPTASGRIIMGTIARTLVGTAVMPFLSRDLVAPFPMRLWRTNPVTGLPVAVVMFGGKMVALPVTFAGFVQPSVAGKRCTGGNQNKCRGKKPYQYGLLFHDVSSLFPSFDRTGAWSAGCRSHDCLRFDSGHLKSQDVSAALKVDKVVYGGRHQ
jgi:hypothetical protein